MFDDASFFLPLDAHALRDSFCGCAATLIRCRIFRATRQTRGFLGLLTFACPWMPRMESRLPSLPPLVTQPLGVLMASARRSWLHLQRRPAVAPGQRALRAQRCFSCVTRACSACFSSCAWRASLGFFGLLATPPPCGFTLSAGAIFLGDTLACSARRFVSGTCFLDYAGRFGFRIGLAFVFGGLRFAESRLLSAFPSGQFLLPPVCMLLPWAVALLLGLGGGLKPLLLRLLLLARRPLQPRLAGWLLLPRPCSSARSASIALCSAFSLGADALCFGPFRASSQL